MRSAALGALLAGQFKVNFAQQPRKLKSFPDLPAWQGQTRSRCFDRWGIKELKRRCVWIVESDENFSDNYTTTA
jgi:hypothetical protein